MKQMHKKKQPFNHFFDPMVVQNGPKFISPKKPYPETPLVHSSTYHLQDFATMLFLSPPLKNAFPPRWPCQICTLPRNMSPHP